MAKSKKKNRIVRKLISIMLICIAIVIFANVGKNIYRYLTLQKQAELVAEELKILEEENATLVSTKTKLEDPNYVETYARGEYMFSKDDEKVFYLPGDKKVEKESEAEEGE